MIIYYSNPREELHLSVLHHGLSASGMHFGLLTSSHFGDEGWICLMQKYNVNEPFKLEIKNITCNYLNRIKIII